MKPKVFIDGSEGTTGLQIYDRLGAREDIELLTVSEELRKDINERCRLINEADIVFLCLPDAAARESVSLLSNDKTRIIDASTAHRTDPGWAYGFPELALELRSAIENARLVANPGCHATGFISLIYPLVKMGVLPLDYPLTCHSVTGYSGGGKSLINEYEAEDRASIYESPRLYGLSLSHKHLPEMTKLCVLEREPVFAPIVCDYYLGMATSVPLHLDLLTSELTARDLRDKMADYYSGQKFISVEPYAADGKIHSGSVAGTNELKISVWGNEKRAMLIAAFDNLGKGASGAAVQNMNIMLGFDEATGL